MRLACKIFDKEKAPRDFLDKFFPRELEILTKIENPHIIQVHSILQRGPRVFIFMRYADNGDLLDFVKRNGVVPEQQSKLWFRQMASGLHYLHGKNIAHRDLKCENILLSRRFNVKLADFGFARFCADGDGRRVLSQTYCGSAAYAAPEVVSGTPYNPKLADVWSLGIILFIMLNASMPFDDSNLRKLLKDQMSRNWVFRSRVRDTVSALAKSIVRHILEPDITLRLTLERVLGHEWVRPRKDKPGSLVGRLVHSAPPVHPAQVTIQNSCQKGRKIFDPGYELGPAKHFGTILARSSSNPDFRRSRFDRIASFLKEFFSHWGEVLELAIRSGPRTYKNGGTASRESITEDRSSVLIIKEVSGLPDSGEKCNHTLDVTPRSFINIPESLESRRSMEIYRKKNIEQEFSLLPEIISEILFQRIPVTDKLKTLIESIKRDAESTLNLNFSLAVSPSNSEEVSSKKSILIATKISQKEGLTADCRSSLLFKVKGSLYSLSPLKNIRVSR